MIASMYHTDLHRQSSLDTYEFRRHQEFHVMIGKGLSTDNGVNQPVPFEEED